MGGSYEIVDYLGRGAMGFVYRARHNILGREYALKTLGADQVSDTSWRRFQIEAQAIAKMSHPNVVGIHNFALHHSEGKADIPFYVMDLLEGSNLGEKLRDNGTPPLAIVLAIFQQAAAGLGYAHSKGMIHRDVKPGNIVLLNRPDAVGATVKIVDFGIAKLTDSQYGAQKLTTAGEVFGSPLYMSPEQSMAQTLDARTDIYSLGVALFESLVGDPPFIANSAVAVMMMHQGEPIPIINDVSEVSYPPEVQQIVEKMMAKMPEDRYQTMEQVASDLAAIARGQEPTLGAARLSDTARLQHRSDSADHAGGNSAYGNSASANLAGRFGETFSGPLFSTSQSGADNSLGDRELDEEPEEKSARTIKSLSVGLVAVTVVVSIALFFVFRQPDWVVKTSASAAKRANRSGPTSGSGIGGQTSASGIGGANTASTGNVSNQPSALSPGDESADRETELGTIDPEVGAGVFKKGGTDYSGLDEIGTRDKKGKNTKSSEFLKKFGGQQKPSAGSQNKTFKYSKILEVNGFKVRRFQFPDDITIGRFEPEKVNKPELAQEAHGTIELNPRFDFSFTPYRCVEDYPQYMKRFRSGDITSVILIEDLCRDKVLEAVSYIPDVTSLRIVGNDGFTGTSVANSLRRFKSLRKFYASEIGVSGAALAEANCWQKIESLLLTKVYGLQPLLKVLKNSHELKGLTLGDANLTSRDIEIVSTISSIRGLDVSQNKITVKDLRTLSKMPNLEYLNLQMCGLDHKALLELKNFSKLREVDAFVPGPNQKAASAPLSRELPNVLVH
ncbi:MAG: eukaryotic-like serine/threonine-protein kinase [Cyanobacteriota bacterium erpe_2018_sw_21hr_WHONDRS-SW48-000092_B_bin.40]|nr:eukaryotic-like serine/threonine-protein kinase [Cyanobacteriota bacterium erpe_2018_sw_21hr_WHONDRS-SW48-000092_B_bin.40]